MFYRCFAFRSRSYEIFSIINDLLKIDAEFMAREVELFCLGIDKECADIIIGLPLKVLQITKKLGLSQKLLNFARSLDNDC